MAETKIDSNGVTFPDATVQATAAKTATKELFAPAVGTDSLIQPQGPLVNGVAEKGMMRMLIPQDFTSISAIEVIFSANETAASMHFDITTYYGSKDGGENWNAHSETEAARDIGATVANQNLAHSIADLVDAVAPVAGDVLIVNVAYNATAIDSNAYVSGLRLKYT